MLTRMILGYIPRSFKAAVALVVMLVSLSAAFDAIGPLIMGHGSVFGVIKLVGSLIIGIAAATIYYPEQKSAAQPKSYDQIEVETLAQAGKDVKYRKMADGAQAWNMDDTPPETQKSPQDKQ